MGYGSDYAHLYDVFYEDKPYRAEVEFIHDRFQAFHDEPPPGDLIEIACGTGRHAAGFTELGYRVVGLDRSWDMISLARARRLRNDAMFLVGDMRSLGVRAESFDYVTCLFDSIGYAGTEDGVVDALGEIARILRPRGLAVIEFWHAPAMLSSFEPVRVRRFSLPRGEILRISETELDERNRQARVSYTVYEHRSDGTFERFSEVQSARFFDVEEMRADMKRAGLSPLAEYGGFSDDEVDAETWHVVMVGQR